MTEPKAPRTPRSKPKRDFGQTDERDALIKAETAKTRATDATKMAKLKEQRLSKPKGLG